MAEGRNERRRHVGAQHVKRAFAVMMQSIPGQWHEYVRAMHLDRIGRGVEHSFWGHCCNALDKIAVFDKEYCGAVAWNLSDDEICALAEKLAMEAEELDAIHTGAEDAECLRVDAVRLLVRIVGVDLPRAISGMGCVNRAKCARWWRRVLRKHVARVVEGGAIRLGVVSHGRGAYASDGAVSRRLAQIARNDAMMGRSFFKNEAGQVFSLRELARSSTANPVIRGGELMVRIRGAEDYADTLGHVGLFLTLTLPSSYHRMTVGSGGRARKNQHYDGVSLPRDGQQWLCKTWARVRAQYQREGIKVYGLRVAEPHGDGTPHWHALLWCETEGAARRLQFIVESQWLRDLPGLDARQARAAKANRVNIKRMIAGGAAGYVAKYIAKSVGHAAMAEHVDLLDGVQVSLDLGGVPGHTRVDAWASHWGIRQFQSVGMPSVTVWRELRRVTKDQMQALRIRTGDVGIERAWHACHKFGNIGADWGRFMRAMGGHCLGRDKWLLRVARRHVEPGTVNGYGEAVPKGQGKIVAVATRGGDWLVSRRLAWMAASDNDVEAAKRAGAIASDGTGSGQALPAPWTRFNNCTARMGGVLRAAIMGIKSPDECIDGLPAVHAYAPAYRAQGAAQGGGQGVGARGALGASRGALWA